MNIDKGIPIPAATFQSQYAELSRQMETGDSILLDSSKKAKSFAQTLRNHGFQQVTRKMPDGWRVWKGEKIVGPQ